MGIDRLLRNFRPLAGTIALVFTLAGVATASMLNMSYSPTSPPGSPTDWPNPTTPDGTPVTPGDGTQYFPGLPYFNGNVPATEDPQFGLVAQIIIPFFRSIVVSSDGNLPPGVSQVNNPCRDFIANCSDAISFDPNWVITNLGPWTPVVDADYGANTFVVADPEPLGRWIITTIVVNGTEPWLKTYSIAEDGHTSDSITLFKSTAPGFGGHLEVTFNSEVPEPSSLFFVGSAIAAALTFRWRSLATAKK